jgi:hypothetical protein
MHGGPNTITLDLEDFTTLLNRLETAEDSRKAAKNSFKEAEKTVKALLNEVKEIRSKAESGSDAEKTAKAKCDAINKSLTIMSTAMNVQTRAIIELAIQDRKMANYWVRSQNTKSVQHNSASMGDELDVVLI